MNKVIIIGNLVRDPELVTTNSGVAMCRFSVAVNRRFANQDGTRETDFLNVVVWRAQGENCHKYLKKGSKVAVVGSIQTRTFEKQDGTKGYSTEIIGEEVEFLNTRQGTEDEAFSPAPAKAQSKKTTVDDFVPVDDSDDGDLPF